MMKKILMATRLSLFFLFVLSTISYQLCVAQQLQKASQQKFDPAKFSTTGPHKVLDLSLKLTDDSRKREIPIKVYIPADLKECPLIVFSHGLGGSCENYQHLGNYWASHGYVSLHITHHGSDSEILKERGPVMQNLARAAAKPENFTNRPKDITFVLDFFENLKKKANALPEMPIIITEAQVKIIDAIDFNRIGVAGHSFGANTTVTIAGATYWMLTRDFSFADKRIKAIVPMSTPVQSRQKDAARMAKMYSTILIPSLHMTGTKDSSPIGESEAEDRRLPYDHSVNSTRYLINFEGGDHMIFSGRPRARPNDTDEGFQKMIRTTSTIFFEAYLRNDGDKEKNDAVEWLQSTGSFKNNGMKEYLGKSAAMERKEKK